MKYRLGLYEKAMPLSLSFAEKFDEAKKAGFDYLELSVDETDEKLSRLDWTIEDIKIVRRSSEDAGIPILSICLSGHRRFPLGDDDPVVRERSLEIMRKACELALSIGVQVIQIAGYDVYYKSSTETTKAFFMENLARSVEYAAGTGVVLAFETMETPFMNTVQKAMDWIKKINSPWLKVYPDLGNITNAAKSEGGDVMQDLETGRGNIAALHLKESKPNVFREVPYGTGHVDFASACRMGR
ncbi:MAG: L-ribulose-5-phosphate 3-epimerase, partial [Treponema sp.]|nr:L-ribulose-5-phosphate 3-epimerase [Treponema sp.]